MNENDFFERCFGIVAGLEVKNESQAIAKEVVLDEIENLQQENKQLKDRIEKALKYVEKMYDVIDYKDYPPYLDELYNVLRIETKGGNNENNK